MCMQLMFPVTSNCFIKCGQWDWQVCIGSKEHNSQGAECKQQAANAPLQNPCLCTFKFLSLGYTCIKGLLGSMLEV